MGDEEAVVGGKFEQSFAILVYFAQIKFPKAAEPLFSPFCVIVCQELLVEDEDFSCVHCLSQLFGIVDFVNICGGRTFQQSSLRTHLFTSYVDFLPGAKVSF